MTDIPNTPTTYEFTLYSPFWDDNETLTIEAETEEYAIAAAEEQAPDTFILDSWTCPNGSSVSQVNDPTPIPTEVEILVRFGDKCAVCSFETTSYGAAIDDAEALLGDSTTVLALRVGATTTYFGKDTRPALADDPTIPPSWR